MHPGVHHNCMTTTHRHAHQSPGQWRDLFSILHLPRSQARLYACPDPIQPCVFNQAKKKLLKTPTKAQGPHFTLMVLFNLLLQPAKTKAKVKVTTVVINKLRSLAVP